MLINQIFSIIFEIFQLKSIHLFLLFFKQKEFIKEAHLNQHLIAIDMKSSQVFEVIKLIKKKI